MSLEEIYAPIQDELRLAKQRLVDDVRGLAQRYASTNATRGKGDLKSRLTVEAIAHLFQSSGKALRPALLLLSAGASQPSGYSRRSATQAVAGIVELIHSASLIHDDVIDESRHRRSIVSVHGKFGVKVAILAGDILFSHAFDVLTTLEETDDATKLELFGLFAELSKQMCYGEIFEQRAIDGTTSVEEYLIVVELKTARLFASSCAAGAMIAGAHPETVTALDDFGLAFGMAYQLLDDSADKDSILRGDFDFRRTGEEYLDAATGYLQTLPESAFRASMNALVESFRSGKK